jgi:predicted nucleic acid-binding protein
MADSLIAGIALAHGLPLMSRNCTRVAGLKLVEVEGQK